MAKQTDLYRISFIGTNLVLDNVKLVEIVSDAGLCHLDLKGNQWLLIKSKGYLTDDITDKELVFNRHDDYSSISERSNPNDELLITGYTTINQMVRRSFYHIDELDGGIRITHNSNLFDGDVHTDLNSIKVEKI